MNEKSASLPAEQRTHFDECWKNGSQHYDCACLKIDRLERAADDLIGALQTVLAYNGAAPDAVQKMKEMAAAALERMGMLS